MQGDISNLADLDRLYDTVGCEKGHLDIVFANAGGGEFAAPGEITEAHFDKTFAANVKGTLFTVQNTGARGASGQCVSALCPVDFVPGCISS